MRDLASIQSIKDLQPIPGADRIECATVLGWKTVVKKNEFRVGELCVFFEIDSLIPRADWNEFLIPKEKKNATHARIKTVCLRGQESQGLAIPIEVLSEIEPSIADKKENEDVTELLGVEKYEVPIPVQLAGKVRGGFPSIIPITDEKRIQKYPEVIDELRG